MLEGVFTGNVRNILPLELSHSAVNDGYFGKYANGQIKITTNASMYTIEGYLYLYAREMGVEIGSQEESRQAPCFIDHVCRNQ